MATNQIIHMRAWAGRKAYSLCMPNAVGAAIDPKKGKVVGNMAALGTSSPKREAVTCRACLAKFGAAA